MIGLFFLLLFQLFLKEGKREQMSIVYILQWNTMNCTFQLVPKYACATSAFSTKDKVVGTCLTLIKSPVIKVYRNPRYLKQMLRSLSIFIPYVYSNFFRLTLKTKNASLFSNEKREKKKFLSWIPIHYFRVLKKN